MSAPQLSLSEVVEELNKVSEKLTTLSKEVIAHRTALDAKDAQIKQLLTTMDQNVKRRSNKIKLDVGGKIFKTSKETLTKIEGSYFHCMLGSSSWQPDDDGSYFIDRNPKMFSFILDYLRTGDFDLTDLTDSAESPLNLQNARAKTRARKCAREETRTRKSAREKRVREKTRAQKRARAKKPRAQKNAVAHNSRAPLFPYATWQLTTFPTLLRSCANVSTSQNAEMFPRIT